MTTSKTRPPPAPLTILDALEDRELFGAHFQPAETWRPWRVALAALFGLPIADEDLGLYRVATGRETTPTEQAREGWFIVGRRGGKSRVAALVAVFLACFRSYREILAPGERATVMVIAADRRQARTVFRYVLGLLEGSPMLARMIERQTTGEIDLSNRVTIEVHTASFRAVRSYTIAAAIVDEVAFWPTDDDAAEPDREIIAALRPGMATVPGAILLGISSPYARRGVLYRAFKDHFGKDGDPVLAWRAPTRVMNASVPEHVIATAYAEDEAAASAEYGAEFRRDVESFVSREALDAVVVPGRYELPPQPAVAATAYVDFAGGTGADSAALAVAFRVERDGVSRAVLAAIRERRPPFNPEEVVEEFCDVLRTYRVDTVYGDRWAVGFVEAALARRGIRFQPAERTTSETFREALPLISSGRVELLDSPRLVTQLLGLERRTTRGGRETIGHAPSPTAHDDVACAACGAIVHAVAGFVREPGDFGITIGSLPRRDEPAAAPVSRTTLDELERRAVEARRKFLHPHRGPLQRVVEGD